VRHASLTSEERQDVADVAILDVDRRQQRAHAERERAGGGDPQREQQDLGPG
jgi:hypothetical protein